MIGGSAQVDPGGRTAASSPLESSKVPGVALVPPPVAGLRPEAGLLPGRPRLGAGVALAAARACFACFAPCLASFFACFASKSRMTAWSMMCSSGSHELNLVRAWGVGHAWAYAGQCAAAVAPTGRTYAAPMPHLWPQPFHLTRNSRPPGLLGSGRCSSTQSTS